MENSMKAPQLKVELLYDPSITTPSDKPEGM
jgi:hypothetical protein